VSTNFYFAWDYLDDQTADATPEWETFDDDDGQPTPSYLEFDTGLWEVHSVFEIR